MKNFKTVEVLFKDSQHNYKTSVNAKSTEESLRDYFVGTSFDLGIYPKEDFQKCINIKIS